YVRAAHHPCIILYLHAALPIYRLGSQLGDVEGTRAGTYAADHRLAATEAVGTGDLAAVESHQVELRTKAARGHLGAFTVTSLDRDAGDALQGLGEVGVRALADVLCADRDDHAGRVALAVHGLVERAAQAGHVPGVP